MALYFLYEKNLKFYKIIHTFLYLERKRKYYIQDPRPFYRCYSFLTVKYFFYKREKYSLKRINQLSISQETLHCKIKRYRSQQLNV